MSGTADRRQLDEAIAAARQQDHARALTLLGPFLAEQADAGIIHMTGVVWQLLGNYPIARRQFLRALELAPGTHHTEVEVAFGYESESDFASSIEWYHKALASGPTDHVLWGRLATLQEAAGDGAGAMETLSRARTFFPADRTIADRLAALLAAAGRPEEARVAQERLRPSAPNVAIVTMAYNESEYLPIWLRHYTRQVSAAHCYVIDHGSSDGSTSGLGDVNVVKIPRSPYDPAKQSSFTSGFCSSLLEWYDFVLYCDTDEILLPDPAIAETLLEYCRRPLPDVVTAIGLNVAHLPSEEPAIRLDTPILGQRRYAFACSSMCKPLLISRPIRWSPGSHSADAPVAFDHLYMFHLRWYDVESGLRRLAKTRAMPWSDAQQGQHQRVSDEAMKTYFDGFASKPKLDDCEMLPDQAPLLPFLNAVRASQAGRESDVYRIDLGIWWDELWRLPQRFLGQF